LLKKLQDIATIKSSITFVKLNSKVKSRIYFEIELLEEYEKVNFYSIRFDGESDTEFEKFLLAFKDSHPDDIAVIMYRLDRITQDGVFPRHFRYAGKMKDRTAELPNNFDTANLRLYCLCISPQILLLGNGGLKTTKTYNEDPYLDKCVTTLQKIDSVLNHKEIKSEITVSGKTLSGDLSLYITD